MIWRLARPTPVKKNSAEVIFLEIGRVMAEAGILKGKPSKPSTVPDGRFMVKTVTGANVVISAAFGGKPLEAIVQANVIK